MALTWSSEERVDFRVLGVLEVAEAGRPVEIGAPKVRSILAELVLHANQLVSRDRLVEVVWGASPPATAGATLNTYVCQLRAALHPSRPRRHPDRTLITRSPGYLLAVDPGCIDAARFERLLAEGRRARADGDLAGAAALLREGLALWRGPALADFRYESFAQAEAARLEELRLAALEERLEADLSLGRHHDVVGELGGLVAEHPLRERLWGQLMVALYRCGRQSEALRAFGELRGVLAEELGIDPSPALRQIEDDVLHQRAELEWHPPAGPRAPSRAAPHPAPHPAPPDEVPSNLPARPSSFVGRQDDVTLVRRLCGSARVVTLTGAGGVGKSRLALEVARSLRPDHPDGVFLVELGPASAADMLRSRVLSALGLGEDGGSSPAETLRAHLSARRLLIVLDNCEHLVAASAALAEELVAAGPHVRVLATSRELLGIAGETAWRVPSLATPPAGTGLERIEAFAASRLFIERARAAAPTLELAPGDAAHVVSICERLDGMPLALELAAARARLLSLGQIAERLTDRFRLLEIAGRSGPGRHRTLRAAVDWSYEGLTATERLLFDRLSVFAGGFTVEAAEEVCAGGDLARPAILDVLSRLADKSMVEVEHRPGPSRVRMLETLRQYGRERLEESGQAPAVRGGHLAWAGAVAREAEPELEGRSQGEWLQRLEAEHDNLGAALGWAASTGDRSGLLSLATALGRFWEVRGHLDEGRRWLELGLAADRCDDQGLLATAHRWAGVLAQRQGDYRAARQRYEASLAISRQAGDRRGTASALHCLANVESLQGRLDSAAGLFEESLGTGRELGDLRIVAASLTNLSWIAQTRADYARARRLSEESLVAWREIGDRRGEAQSLGALAHLAILQGDLPAVRDLCGRSLAIQRQLGDRDGMSWSLTYLGWAAQDQGELAAARRFHDEALALRRELGDRYGTAWSLSHLGDLERASGGLEAAGRLLRDSLAIARELGDTYCVAWSLMRLGKLAREQGDPAAAEELFREGVSVARARGEKVALAGCLEGLAGILATDGRPGGAARLLGVADAVREGAGTPRPPAERSAHQRDVAAARARLGEEAFAAARAAGRRASLDEVIGAGG